MDLFRLHHRMMIAFLLALVSLLSLGASNCVIVPPDEHPVVSSSTEAVSRLNKDHQEVLSYLDEGGATVSIGSPLHKLEAELQPAFRGVRSLSGLRLELWADKETCHGSEYCHLYQFNLQGSSSAGYQRGEIAWNPGFESPYKVEMVHPASLRTGVDVQRIGDALSAADPYIKKLISAYTANLQQEALSIIDRKILHCPAGTAPFEVSAPTSSETGIKKLPIPSAEFKDAYACGIGGQSNAPIGPYVQGKDPDLALGRAEYWGCYDEEGEFERTSARPNERCWGGSRAIGVGWSPNGERLAPRNKHAVVIGVNHYSDPGVADLRFAERDAEAVGSFLEGKGFQVTTLLGSAVTKRTVETELENLITKRSHPGDQILVYFSGHGVDAPFHLGNSRGLLLAHDSDPDNFGATAIPMASLQAVLHGAAGQRAIVILDACFAAGGKSYSSGRTTKAPPCSDCITGQLEDGRGRAFLFSSKDNEHSIESSTYQHGLMTHHLLAAWKEGKRSFHEVYQYVYSGVLRDSGGHQHPVSRIDEQEGALAMY